MDANENPVRARNWYRGGYCPCDSSLFRQLLRPLVRWYALRQLPSYGYLLHWWGMNREPAWDQAPVVRIRGRAHGYRMRLDLSDFYQRIAYFVGGWHELDVVSGVEACLRSGDAFIDGGANIGLLTLHAAKVVGPGGRIDAFEVFPPVLDSLRWHLQTNRLEGRAHVHAKGLGAEQAELVLKLPGRRSSAAATLGAVPARYGIYQKEVGVVPVVRGDDVIPRDDGRSLTIKLDVEGFEVAALRGLARTIEQRRPAIIVEMNAEMLEHCGSNLHELCGVLAAHGYVALAMDRQGFLGRHKLRLHPLRAEHVAREHDVLWVMPGSVHWQRIGPLVQPAGGYWRDGLAEFHRTRRERWERRLRFMRLDWIPRWMATGSRRRCS